tara:strand:+ start:240 stop:1067 length:828 start_codon:yes stop_codon:yes gene_type:complete
MLLGLNQVLVKIVNSGIQPVFQAGLRSLLAIIPVIIIVKLLNRDLTLEKDCILPGLICGIFFGIEFIFLFLSLDYTSVAHSSILFYSMPVWLCIASHYLIPGEKFTILKVAGLFLSVSGIFIALSINTYEQNISFIGDILALLASLLWAAIVILVKISSLRKTSPEIQLLFQLVVSSLILIPISFFFGDFIRDISFEIILIFLFQIIVIISIGFLVWFWILSIYPASKMASFSFLAPMFGVMFGWLILDEQINIYILSSLFLVCTGIVLINKSKN